MNNRRDFLKLFGAGAAVVPVLSGAPVLEAAGRLVEPAKVEAIRVPIEIAPVQPRVPVGWPGKSIYDALLARQVAVTVLVHGMGSFDALMETRCLDVRTPPIEISTSSAEYRQFISGQVRFKLEGDFLALSRL